MRRRVKIAAVSALCGALAAAGFLWYAHITGDGEGVTAARVAGGMFLLLTVLSAVRFK